MTRRIPGGAVFGRQKSAKVDTSLLRRRRVRLFNRVIDTLVRLNETETPCVCPIRRRKTFVPTASMNLYRIKRKLLTPYVWYMRHKERAQVGFIKSALEVHYYRPTFYRWLRASMLDKDILHDAPLDSASVVLDVGAHVGDWAQKVIERYDAHMYLFEPNPPFFKKIETRFADNPKVRCFRYGLHDCDTVLRLQQQDQGSTIFDENKRGQHSVRVKLRDIVAVLDELHIDEVGLLKLNIEGGEYDVLERLVSAGRMPSIRCVLVQYHEWRDAAYVRRFKLQRQFRRTHRLEWDYPFIWEKWIRR